MNPIDQITGSSFFQQKVNHLKVISKENKSAVATIYIVCILCTLACVLFKGDAFFKFSISVLNLVITTLLFIIWALLKKKLKPLNEITDL